MPKGHGYDKAPKKASAFKMKGWSPFKKEETPKQKVKETYNKKGELVKTKGDKSSVYKVDKVEQNKDGSKTTIYKNELGNTETRTSRKIQTK